MNRICVRGLTVRVGMTFVVVVFLTALVIGVPAVGMLTQQLNAYAWAQVEQGQRAAISLYAAKHTEVRQLVVLIAQRPTLQELLIEGDMDALAYYLEEMRLAAGLTRIIICSPDEKIMVTTDASVPESICNSWKTGNYQYSARSLTAKACLTAHQPIQTDTELLGDLFICIQLNDQFAENMSIKTGLEHIIWINDRVVSTSFDMGPESFAEHHHIAVPWNDWESHHQCEINGVTYYAAHIPLQEDGLSAEVALDVTQIAIMRDTLIRWVVIAAFVMLGVAVLGVWFCSQKSQAELENEAS